VTLTPAAFYFDLASPSAYLVAEQILHALPAPAEWHPVLAATIAQGSPREDRRGSSGGEVDRPAIARRARELGLQAMRWPEPFPFDSALAMRVATYAKSIGRVVPFAQAAFRQAYAGGHSLEDPDFVLIAAAACEMHPLAVLQGAALRSVAEQLDRATAAAIGVGVADVPAIVVRGVEPRVFAGEGALERAAELMHAGPRGPL
jgi:2-hydroxychromene-2-carboxylate isomerase